MLRGYQGGMREAAPERLVAWIRWIAFWADEGAITDSNIAESDKLIGGQLAYMRSRAWLETLGITGCGLLQNLQSD